MPRYGLINDDDVDEDNDGGNVQLNAETQETSKDEFDLLEAQSRSSAIVQKCRYPFKVKNPFQSEEDISAVHGAVHTPEQASGRLRAIKVESQEWTGGDVSTFELGASVKTKRLKLESWQCDGEQNYDMRSDASLSLKGSGQLGSRDHCQPFFKRELRWDSQQSQSVFDKIAPSSASSCLVERKPRVPLSELTSDIFKTLEVSPRGVFSAACRACRVSFGPPCRYGVIECSTLTVVPSIENFFHSYLKRHGRMGELEQLLSTELLRWNPPSPLLKILDNWIFCAKSRERLGDDAVEDNNSVDRVIEGLCDAILLPLDVPSRGIRQRTLFGRWLAEYLGERSYLSPGQTNQAMRKDPSYFSHIFDCLINGQPERATHIAKRNGLYNLALLISMFKIARKGKYEAADEHYSKILQLMAGDWKPRISTSKARGSLSTASCLLGLNSLQVLGIICWYWAAPSNSLDDIVKLFGQIEKVIHLAN